MLIDSHIHISLDGLDFAKSRKQHLNRVDYSIIRKILKEYKQKGILILRDGGDNLNVSEAAREIAREEGMIVRTPVYAFYKYGCYGSFLGKPVADKKEFKAEFTKLIKRKPDHIKIILSGLVDFKHFGRIGGLFFSTEELVYMVQTAKDRGLPAMVHANSPEAVRIAVNAGADTIEHGYYLTENEMDLMVELKTTWVPTLAPLGNIVMNGRANNIEEYEIISRVYLLHQEKIMQAYQKGVKLAIGSDAGASGVVHGQGFWDEVTHFLKAGFTEESIKQTFVNNAFSALNISGEELDSLSDSQDVGSGRAALTKK